MSPWSLASAEWRTQRLAFWGVSLLLAFALAFSLGLNWIERGLREAGARTAGRFDLIVGVAGSPTQLVLSALYLQPHALPLLPRDARSRLEADPGVAQVIPLVGGDAVGHYPVVGTSAALIQGGRFFSVAQGRAFSARQEAVVGTDVGLALGAVFNASHGAPHERGSAFDEDEHLSPVTVVGRLARSDSPWDKAILLPVEQMWAVHGHDADHSGQQGQVTMLVVQPRSVADAYRLRQQWRQGGTMGVFPAEVLAELFDMLGDARRLLAALAWGSQALVLGAGLLTVAVLLSTRRQSYAALRAIGAPRAYIFGLSWLLAIGVGWRACLLALPLAWGISRASGALLQSSIGLPLSPVPQAIDLLLPAGLLLAAGIGATALSWRASVRPVLEELRA